MAITRASWKSYRIPLSFLAVMAGLEVTPAEEMPPVEQTQPIPEQTRTHTQNDELASEKQQAAVRGLIENAHVYPNEKRQIHGFIEDGLTKVKSKELLDFFYGVSILVDGAWTKTSMGKLEERRNH